MYLLFTRENASDLCAKIDGPTVVEPLSGDLATRDDVVAAAKRTPDAPAGNDLAALVAARPERFDLTKPYFIGQREAAALAGDDSANARRVYAYSPPETPARRTVLHDRHVALGGKITPFAGWDMPVHYGPGIFAEHRAVRSAAGLFDVSHMSQFEIAGPASARFLDGALANCVTRLEPGFAQYTCALYPDGTAVDDLYLYRIARDSFILVSNAGNAERVLDWLRAMLSGEYVVDTAMSTKRLPDDVTIRDLRDAGEDSLTAMALQGPCSRKVLLALATEPKDAARIAMMEHNAFRRVCLGGIGALVARTGYTKGRNIVLTATSHHGDTETRRYDNTENV